MSRSQHRPGLPVRAFRSLLRIYPPAFRERHRDDLLEAFEDSWCEEMEGADLLARVRFWLRLVRDALQVRTRAEGDPVQRELPRRNPPRFLSALGADARYAFRSLAKQPGFAATVVTMLALGIGANAVVFDALHDVVIRPLPYAASDRLVRVFEYFGTEPARNYVTAPSFLGWRDRMQTLDRAAALYTYRETGADYTDGDRPERLRTLRVSASYLEAYGTAPYLGRDFTREEERGDVDVAVVSHRFWRTRLGGARDVLGRRITLDGTPHTVVGVAPDGFADALAGPVDVWLSLDLDRHRESTGNWYLSVVGRLGPGVDLDLARDESERVERSLEEELDGLRDHHPHLVPLQQDVVGASGGALGLLMGAVGVVLLIACVNVAQLMRVRGLARERELAVRAALGCGRSRLVRQLLLESLLLAMAGALGGLLLARLGSGLWLALAGSSLPRAVDGRIDWVLLSFAAGVAVVTAILFGLVPALRGSRVDVGRALHESARGHSGGSGLSATRRVLIATQLALTFVLTAGAVLLTKSFLRLADVDLSVETEGIVAFDVSLPSGRYPEAAQRAVFHRQLAQRLEALPGVRAAGSVSWLPAQGHYHEWGFFLPRLGDGTPEGSPNGLADQRIVEGRFFEALRIPLLRGRLFDSRDVEEAPPVVLVNEELVRCCIPEGVDPIGETLWVADGEREIVGLVADTAVDVRGEAAPTIYHTHRQMADDRNWALVQVVASDGSVPLRDMAEPLSELDPGLVLYEPRELAPLFEEGISRERLLAYLLVAFAGVGLLLAGLGLFGVLSHSVGQRRREFGIRLALGATPAAVRGLVLRQAAVVATIGALAGLATSLWAGRWVGAFLFETDAQDPATLAAAAAALVALALLAAFLPARRATRMAPAEVLRAD